MKMILLHEVVAPMIIIKKKYQEILKLLKVENKVIDLIQEWGAKYPNFLEKFGQEGNNCRRDGKVQLRLHIHNYTCLGEKATNTITSYGQLHNGLESLTQKHGMPFVGTLGEIRGKDVIMHVIKQFIEKIKQTFGHEGPEITKKIILQYAIAPAKLHMKLSSLWNNVQSSSKSILSRALGVKM